MLRLRRAHDVEEQRCLDSLDPVENTCQIAGAVIEPATTLLDDQRQRGTVAIRVTGREHDIGPVADLQQAGRAQPLDDLGQQVVVHALAGQIVVGQQHVEFAVQPIEVGHAQIDEQLPQPKRLGITTLQQHDAIAGSGLERLTGVELCPSLLVETVEITDAEPGSCLGLTDVEQMLDEHSERRAPVADVVLADHGVADELEQARPGRRR